MSITAKVYSSQSPLRHPRRFLEDAARDLITSTDFARRLFRQSIAQRYRHSSLGLLWAFAPPLVTALVVALTRRGMPQASSTAAVAPPLYAVFGLMMAQTFLETFYTQRTIFSSNRMLLGRQRATVESMILAGLYDNLFGLVIRTAILVCFMVAYRAVPALTFPLGLLGIGVIFLLGSGLGLCFAPLSALKSDVDKILTFLPWLLFAVTPVFTPAVAGSAAGRVYERNPFTWLFDTVRAFTFGHVNGHISILVLSLLSSLCIFPVAALFCRIARPHVVERLLD